MSFLQRCALILLGLATGPGWAANVVTPGFEPSQIERQIEQAPFTPAETVVPTLPEVATLGDALPEQRFVLSAVLVEGVTVYSNLEISRLYESLLGKTVTVQDMRDIADQITRHYRSNGYFLTSAFLPAQAIEYGIVRIRVVEGYVGRVEVTGAATRADPLINGMVAPLLRQRPSRRAMLDDVFQRLSGLQDLNMYPEVKPITDQLGAYELSLRAEKKRFDGSVSIDNRGSPIIGPTQGVVSLRALDLLGQHEAYQLKLATAAPTSELRYIEASTDWILNPSGLRLQASVSRTVAEPGGSLKSLQAEVVNSRRQIGLLYPLPYRDNVSRYVGAALINYHSRTDVRGVKRLEDRLTSLSLSYRQNWQQSASTAHSMGIALGQGLKLDDSVVVDTQLGSGTGRPDFTKLTSSYGFKHAFGKDLAVEVLLDAQYGLTALPNSERYSLGGALFGRAYDPSELSGDHGLASRFELSRALQQSIGGWRFAPYGYYDLGAVWDRDPTDGHTRKSAASLGLGVRADYQGFASYLELAKPLTRQVASQGEDGRDVRLFAGAAYRF